MIRLFHSVGGLSEVI